MRRIDFSKPPKRRKAVIWHVAGGWLSNLILIVQGLLLIPLYLHFLGERLYGFWLASGGVLALLSMMDVGASAVTQQRCAAAYGRKDMTEVTRYFWHGAVVMAGVLLVFFSMTCLIAIGLPEWLKVDTEYRDLIVATFIVTGFAAVGRLANDFMRYFASALQRNQYPVFAQTLGDMLGLVTIVLALVVFQMGLWSLALGALARTLVPFLSNLVHTAWILVSIGATNQWSAKVFSDYYKTTPSVLFAKATGQISQNLPSILIARFIGPEANVMFTVTFRVVFMVRSFLNHALSGLYAACTHYFGDPSVSAAKEARTVSSLVRGYAVGAGLGVLLYALFNHGFVSLWTSESQFAGQAFTTLAALATFIHVRDTLLVGLGGSIGSIREVHVIRACENLLTMVLSVFGIYYLGLIGSLIAVILSGLSLQYFYFKLFTEKKPSIAKALRPLAWLWFPLGGALLVCFLLSPYFVTDHWLRFIAQCALAGAPLVLVGLFSFPKLKDKLVHLLGKFPLGRKALMT
ncbi:hypothetical protein [Coraliomargarita akajimensis]|uniref:Polysaccharide biosynthesis protein n=1 Tax=Coraliomargarita akajimensis (strain DSM 45221 / IAM 15411 / JCM 23193 / KCTC 12865 / 04OKA010-24) TaxID=583355 RepID=D5EML1_CORAD|nr:hypothetical protein [Coraliomargarita akajimensis]ADE53417.1 hypothetical protein Caka_0392 [Coraliomargarita akajimensis DSM 45221]